MPAQDPVDGSDSRQRLYAKFFHLSVNVLSTIEQVLVVKIEGTIFKKCSPPANR